MIIERIKVVVHTLRHTFASHLAINGTPIFTMLQPIDSDTQPETFGQFESRIFLSYKL